LKNPFPIIATEDVFAGAFGVRHQAGQVAAFIADAGDILEGTIGIGRFRDISASAAILP
jgi:hypothetical protein